MSELRVRTPPGTAPSSGPRPRGLRLLARLGRHRTPVAPVPRTAQVRALLAVLDEAVAAQRSVDAAVAACGSPDGVTGPEAQDCGRAGSRCHQAQARLRDVPLSEADLVELRGLAGRLLAYDQWMVRQAMDLAFTTHPDARTEAARLQLNGLGRPADDLRRLRDSVRSRLPDAP